MTVDHRFFKPKGALDLGAVAERTHAELSNGVAAQLIHGIASHGSALVGEVCFFEGDVNTIEDISSDASACFVRRKLADHLPDGVAALIVERPRYAHALLGEALFEYPDWTTGDMPIASSAKVHPQARIATGVTIAAEAAIGEGTTVGPNSCIGAGVQIGKNCRIGANVSIQCALIGDGVSVLSGARIGEAGFGVLEGPEGPVDAPQYGRVIIQDHVTIGANTTIDRGAFDDTIIGELSKIDNLCQIGHNVVLGRGVFIAAFGGISGSVTLQDGVQLGGRVGIADHVDIGPNAKLAASAGVFRNVPAGEVWGGTPAKPFRQWMKETAWLQRQTKPKKS